MGDKPHAVCIPCPAQGHINSMLKFSKLLHAKGFHITFVHTVSSRDRILATSGPSALDGLPGFVFEVISDGLSPSERPPMNAENLSYVSPTMRKALSDPFRWLMKRLDDRLKVTCIVSDAFMSLTLEIAEEFGVPDVSFCSVSACGFLGFYYSKELIERGIVPLKSEDDLTNGYLDTPIDYMPGLKNLRLRDFPSFVRTTDPNNVLLRITMDEAQEAAKAAAVVVHTFDDLEGPALEAMSSLLPPVYAIGTLNLMCHQTLDGPLKAIGSNLWENDDGCLGWLEGKAPGSVLYVNFGSLAVVSRKQLVEFGWGLANSGHDFLWVMRPDIVTGDSAVVPEELLLEVSERGLLTSWCPQEEVLMHPSVGGFLTHCGWNSSMDSISCGVPMICWPYFADQQTNCRYMCNEWGIGLEAGNDVKREEVEGLIRELMGGEKGKEMRRMALKWKESAAKATSKPEGKSLQNFERLLEEVILPKKK